jgi:hypothetical protein
MYSFVFCYEQVVMLCWLLALNVLHMFYYCMMLLIIEGIIGCIPTETHDGSLVFPATCSADDVLGEVGGAVGRQTEFVADDYVR